MNTAENHEIRLYLLDVDTLQDPRLFSALLERMSSERRERVLAFRGPDAQRLCLGAGVLLDFWLHTLGLCLRGVRVHVGAHGKPSIAEAGALDVNVSHSGHYAALAAAPGQIGVDIQIMRAMQPRVAKRCFTSEEQAALERAASPELKNDLFCRLWTLKESYVKATGQGLSVPLHSFAVKAEKHGATLVPPGAYVFYEPPAPVGYRLAVCSTCQDAEINLLWVNADAWAGFINGQEG